MGTVALYMRLSSEDAHAGESYSIGNQRDLLYRYIRENREFDGCSILEFSDDGYSGVNFDRPGIQKLLSLAGKTVDCILVKDFSRFGRNLVEVGDYLDQIFPFLGVRFIAVNEGYDSGKGLGSSVSLDVSLKAFVYEMYSRDVSEKVRNVKQAKMRKGEYQCAIAFYGYKKSEVIKNRLEIDGPAAEIVRKIFHMAGEGMRPSQIALKLNEEGILSPLMYRKANHTDRMRGWKVVGDAVWMRGNVRRILSDERYTGCLIGHKRTKPDISAKRTVGLPQEEWIVARNTHDAIVSEQEYRKAQEVLKHYIPQGPQKKPFQRFRGILKCACCGRALVRKARKIPYFICLTSMSIKDTDCIKVRLEERGLERALLEAIKVQVQISAGDAPNQAEVAGNDPQKEMGECQMALGRYKALKMAAFEDYAEGRIGKEEYLARKKEAEGHQEEMNNQIRALNDQLAMRQGQKAEPGVDFGKYVFVEELTREVLVELVKEIRVSGDNQIEIEWNFREEAPIDVLSCQKAET
ncbi:MAG: recombinase family protein [Butyrivibrio sp.]|nr:recombinase family protein [Butyrivibrio sp.]